MFAALEELSSLERWTKPPWSIREVPDGHRSLWPGRAGRGWLRLLRPSPGFVIWDMACGLLCIPTAAPLGTADQLLQLAGCFLSWEPRSAFKTKTKKPFPTVSDPGGFHQSGESSPCCEKPKALIHQTT